MLPQVNPQSGPVNSGSEWILRIELLKKPAIEISLKLQIQNDNIVVHINSKDINWDIILMQPNMEYLLLPENADKSKNNIDRPEIIRINTRENIKLIK